MKRLSTDVLVVGSGGAGLRTGIEARRMGANVLVVTKSRAGRANCTSVAMGAFQVSQETMDIERHFRVTLEAGRFLNNPKLVRILVNGAWPAISELEGFGVELRIEQGKASIVSERKPAGILLSSWPSMLCVQASRCWRGRLYSTWLLRRRGVSEHWP